MSTGPLTSVDSAAQDSLQRQDTPQLDLNGMQEVYLNRVDRIDQKFALESLKGAKSFLEAFNIPAMQILDEEKNFVVFTATAGPSLEFMLSLPRTQRLTAFSKDLTKVQLNYVLGHPEKIVLCYAEINGFTIPDGETRNLAGELFDTRRFFQGVRNTALVANLMDRVVGTFVSKGTLKTSSNSNDAISFLKRIHSQLISG